MIKPETFDFIGNELDKAKLEIVSYWKDNYEKTRKALDIAVNALKLFYSGQFTLQPDAYGIKKDASYSAQIALAEVKTALEQKKMTPQEFADLELLANTTFK